MFSVFHPLLLLKLISIEKQNLHLLSIVSRSSVLLAPLPLSKSFLDGRVDGWMNGKKPGSRDCLTQSKMTNLFVTFHSAS